MNPASKKKNKQILNDHKQGLGLQLSNTCSSFTFMVDFYLGGIDQLIGQTLGNGLDVPEGGFSRSRAQQPDGLNRDNKGQGCGKYTQMGCTSAMRHVSELVVGWATSDYSQ